VRAAGGGGDDEEEEDDGDDGDGDDGDDGGDDLSGWRGVGPQRPVLTGPDGRFTISGLRRGAYEVVAEGDKGRARARREGVKTGDSVTLVLDKLGSLAGVVTVAGAPVADYSIECDGPGGEQRRRVAAADGAYAFERLPPGTYRCTATAAAGTATGEATVANAPARLDLALGAWGAVAGRAIDARTSAALAGLKLMVTGVADEGEGAASFLTGGGPTTDASGRFEVGKCTAGTGHLVIFDAGMASFEPLATRDFELAAGQRLDLGDIRVVPKPAGPPGYLGLVLGPDDDALVIASVADGGPARAAGLAAGDRVIAVDGLAVADLGADVARRLVEQTTVGQVVAFGIERGGTRHDISVTAVAPPAP
jgi:membrane-associated protease RseP (regulator of RpoE activity)